MFDRLLAEAQMASIELQLQHSIRIAIAMKDVEFLKTIGAKLSNLSTYADRQARYLRRPERWQYVCMECGYRREPNVGGRKMCPQCGECMKMVDLSKVVPQ